MTRVPIAIMETGAGDERDGSLMKLDLFEGAVWRRKVSEPSVDGSVTVTLSTGKTVTCNSRFLGLLRVLVEELAKEEPKPH